MNYREFSEENPFYFERSNHAKTPGFMYTQEHYHNFYEIYYIENGSCGYFINNKSYQMTKGDVVLIPEGVIHHTIYTVDKPTRLLVNCTHKYIPSSVFPLAYSDNYLYRNPNQINEIHTILQKIEKEYNNPDNFSDESILCLMYSFFFLIARNKNYYISQNVQSSYIEHAIDYIQNNLSSDISLSEIATMFSVSSEHFSRSFKKETGFGFNQYLNLLRLKKAETLLKQSTLSVAEVAEECGFNDSNYFSIKFKKMYNIPPKSVQLMYRKSENKK